MLTKKIFHILLTLPLLFSQISSAASIPQFPWQSKIDAWVIETAVQEGQTEFLVFLTQQADLSKAAQLTSKAEKGHYVYQQLSQLAAQTQPAILEELHRARLSRTDGQPQIAYRSYWVANMIWVNGDQALLEQLARRSDVQHIYANPAVHLDEPQAASEMDRGQISTTPQAIEWNIDKVQAPTVWAAGYRGQGAVVAGQDTGYDWDHPALKNQYRGWNGADADHNYNWHDAIHANDSHTEAGNPCGFNSTEPCDDHIHGTHTMGIMAGDDGGSNQVGMAPAAQWIGCRNMEEGWGKPSTYSECYQWFIAPTDLDDQNPRPDLAPDVINNSWGCTTSEGCTDPSMLLTVVQNVRAAGILTVHSAGNSGPGCGSISEPAAIYDESFTVGNTTNTDTIAGNSSRGPVTIDGSGRPKPDISAPGSNIRSSTPNGNYSNLSGTSMAAPHVAGLVALLISAQPKLSGQVDQIETLIKQTALPLTTYETCGGIPSGQVPNNTFGWGRIDAWKAFTHVPHALQISKTAHDWRITPGDLLTYTLELTHFHPLTPTYSLALTDTLPVYTSLVSATEPYVQNGNTIQWNFTSLGAGSATTSVQLVVQVSNPLTVTSLTNFDYGARSAEVASTTAAPVETLVSYGITMLPMIQKP